MVHCPTNGGTIWTIGVTTTSKDDAPGQSTAAAITVVVVVVAIVAVVAVVGVTAAVPIPCK